MALTIEDGSVVADAESYVTFAELQVFATARAFTLPDEAGCEILLRKASDYLESLESRFQGERVDVAQSLCWPRSGVYLFGSETEFGPNAIPAQLKKAQLQLACEAISTELLPTGTGRETLREKVDVLEVQYAQGGSNSVLPEFNQALAFLAPLLKGEGSFELRTLRV